MKKAWIKVIEEYHGAPFEEEKHGLYEPNTPHMNELIWQAASEYEAPFEAKKNTRARTLFRKPSNA